MDTLELLRVLAERDPEGKFLARYQERLLQQTLRYAYACSPFYRSKFDEFRLRPEDVKTRADLAQLPFFTTPADIARDPQQFLAVPAASVTHTWKSAGTTGRPKEIYFSDDDMAALIRVVKQSLMLLNPGERAVAQVCYAFADSSWFTGPFLGMALEAAGIRVVRAGNALSVREQIDLMASEGTTMLFGTPSYIHRLTEEGKELADLRALHIRLITLGAEPWPESLRCYLQEAWGAEVYDNYGMTEMGLLIASECPAHSGLHTSSALMVEIIDPETGQPAPPGEQGELVLTTLERKAMPLLRYRSGDLSSLAPEAGCACKVVLTPRITRIKSRLDDLIILADGENIYPKQLDDLLLPIEHLLDYQLILTRESYRDVLLFRVVTDAPSEALERAISDRLYAGLGFLQHDVERARTIARPRIEFVAPGRANETAPIKARRIVDRRAAAL